MMRAFSIFLLLAINALGAAGQGGGWYVVNESLTCTSICDIHGGCNIIGGPDEATIARFCKEITDDCADGQLSEGRRYFGFGANGSLGTNNFGTGSSDGNNGCPNNNDCISSFKYLAGNMRYPSAPGYPNAYCNAASITINGHYNHQKTGSIIVQLSTIRSKPP